MTEIEDYELKRAYLERTMGEYREAAERLRELAPENRDMMDRAVRYEGIADGLRQALLVLDDWKE